MVFRDETAFQNSFSYRKCADKMWKLDRIVVQDPTTAD